MSIVLSYIKCPLTKGAEYSEYGVNIYTFKVNSRNTRKRCAKSPNNNIPEQHHCELCE